MRQSAQLWCFQGATSIASDSRGTSPSLIAVAVPARLTTKKTSVDVYEVRRDALSGEGPPTHFVRQYTISEEVKVEIRFMEDFQLDPHSSLVHSNVGD